MSPPVILIPEMEPAPPIDLRTHLSKVPGLNKRDLDSLALLGLTNVGRLIAHLPLRHESLESESAISSLEADRLCATRGEIAATRVARARGRSPARFEAALTDDTGRLDLVWFNQPYLANRLHPARIRVQGKTKRRGLGLQMVNPIYELIAESGGEPALREARVRPVYPLVEGVHQRHIEKALDLTLDAALPLIEDHLPSSYRAERELPTLADAYRMIHRPATDADVAAAHRRLAYDELLLLQLGVQMRRARLREGLIAPSLRADAKVDEHIRRRIPFTLTDAQNRVVAEIVSDLARPIPTNRLIQGDVGSGKTVIAAYAMLMAVASGHQAAMMVPTEILAEQHFDSLSRMLAGSKVSIAMLTGSTPASERAATLDALASGTIDLLVGTHALLTDTVRFKSLAVAIIDEQHRFGVHQRARMRAKAEDATSTPHVLVMTATPIPRTLAITIFGDLDVSTIDALPPGRKPVKTALFGRAQRSLVYEQVKRRIDRGEQAFIVVPAIGDTVSGSGEEPESGATTAHALTQELSLPESPLAGVTLATLHGRLPHAERERIMEAFRAGSIQALVATTVIEVGVDIPNATIIAIEDADRFGLAQLHQLRGRVGRGRKPSVCMLIADPVTPEGAERLKALTSTTDGFKLAETDFLLRGPGELFGARQSGSMPLKVADLTRDLDLLSLARHDAASWIKRSPTLSQPGEALLVRRLKLAFGDELGLADVG
ncbi:MAG: ATP-dependent DNA helicase RecG [Phycisphaeraceae bacterium]|nr:ATP-dependent DNA helicase RecG [Phycisphaeraceae bacterium]